MFTLAQLTAFRYVRETGSFSQAAQLLGVTQPAVSQQLAVLQRHFDTALVEVVKGRLRLTDAGRFLAARSEQLLANAAALESDMQEFAATRSGTLRIGATVTIGTYGLGPLLAAFAQEHPGIDVRISIANTDAIVAAVRAGETALALVAGPAAGDDIDIVPYEDDELVLIVAPTHRFAKRRSVRVTDLAGERFIMREPGSGTRQLVETVLSAAGVTPATVLELPSGDAISRAVESNLGISIVSRKIVERDVVLGRLKIVRLPDVDLRRTFRMIRSRLYAPSPAGLAFAALVRGRARYVDPLRDAVDLPDVR
jgi:DNA-binding transcriptional LysR family regulator